MVRKAVNTTLEEALYSKLQFLALQLSAERGVKVNANDLLEEGMQYVISKYEADKKN